MVWLLTLLITNSFALEKTSFPKNWCSTNRCSETQKIIWTDFNNGGSPNWGNMPSMMSGSCYHSASYYNNKHEHFSGVFIEKETNGFSFFGRHSFFATPNPYSEFTVETARREFKKDHNARITIFPDYGYYNADPEASGSIRYWLREGTDGRIKLATVWGSLSHFSLCDLEIHKY